MPLTASGVTSYSQAGQGLFTGWKAQHERDLGDKIAEKWLDQTKMMALIPRKLTGFRQNHWPVYTDQTVNAAPQHEGTRPSDHTPTTWEPFLLENVTTILKALAQVTAAEQTYKKNWVKDELGKQTRLAVQHMLRGVEQNLVYGEYNNSSTALVPHSNAGLGTNAAGDALASTAGTHWSTDIADTNSRMVQRDHGGADFDYDELQALVEAITNNGGQPEDIFVDTYNKKIIDEWTGQNERKTWRGTDERTKQLVEVIDTTFGQYKVHLMRRNYPFRAVMALDLNPECISWGPVEGLGLQLFPLALNGDIFEQMIRIEFTLCVRCPHAHGYTFNTNG